MNPMSRLGAKGTMYIAVGIAAIGFLLIFLGWNGAAEKDFVSGQIPYIISGGLAGVGLVFVGMTIVLVRAHREDTARLAEKLDRLLERFEGIEAPEGASDETAPIDRRESRAPRSA